MSILHFKTNAQLKNLIGKDLINDDNIAIVELVKNSCDARSRKIKVEFHNLNYDENSKIIIYDNGTGMNRNDIENKWLNIAYSDKANRKVKHKGFIAGNKGIGRFSCDRLGSKLDMFTRKAGGELLHLKIDWVDFEKKIEANQTIDKINVILQKTTEAKIGKMLGEKMPASGTVLTITSLRSQWARENLLTLKRHLEKFIGPNQPFVKGGFSLSLIAPDEQPNDEERDGYHDQVNGKVKNTIFEQLKFNTTYMDSRISDDGKTIETKLMHEGERVYQLTEKNKYTELHNIRIIVYYLNAYKKSYFKRQTGTRLIDFGSIFLFLNGFRVSPYGDRGNDWLGLEIRKGQRQLSYLASRDVVGRIEIHNNGDSFKPISSREGLKETPEFKLLRNSYFMDTHRRLEKFVVEGLNWDSVPPHIRSEVRSEEGLDWEKTVENYNESRGKKRARIISSIILPLIGGEKKNILRLWFNPSLLEDVAGTKQAELEKLLEDIEGFDTSIIGSSLKRNLNKFRKVLDKKDTQIKAARRKISKLEDEKRNQKVKIVNLKKEKGQYERQTLFLKSVSTLDEKRLLGFHHQICLDSAIIDNYVTRAIKSLKDIPQTQSALSYLEKISKANRKIMATAQFATKANFTSASKKENTDIPAYFTEYLQNVSSEFLASGLKVTTNQFTGPFAIPAKK